MAAYLAKSDGSNSEVVAVGADWTDNRHLLGWLNHLRTVERDGKELPVYQTTKTLDLLLRASDKSNQQIPFFLVLDEMNLSHVERYFADFLSVMEQKDGVLDLHNEGPAGDKEFTLPRHEGDSEGVPRTLPWPKNLFVIGTVNIDETTYMFSPKVLDRANVIEFKVGKTKIAEFLKDPQPYPETRPAKSGIAEGFQKLAEQARSKEGLDAIDETPKGQIKKILTDLFVIMERGRFEFAYRTANEVMRYLSVCQHLADDREEWKKSGWELDLDDQILQKILPKLHGSIGRIGSLLVELARFCKEAPGDGETEPVNTGPAMQNAIELDLKGARFKKSLKKLQSMLATLKEEQFVSFIQ